MVRVKFINKINHIGLNVYFKDKSYTETSCAIYNVMIIKEFFYLLAFSAAMFHHFFFRITGLLMSLLLVLYIR